MSLPFCAVAGVAASDAEAARALHRAARTLGERIGAQHLEIRNPEPREPAWPRQDLYASFRKALAPQAEANMRGLDCFVLPSLGEGISNTVLEAMATRLAIIATRVGGNAELIEPGMTGLLVPPGDRDALADALVRYSGDRAMARRHAKAARRVAQSRFSLARMVSDYCSLYETALAAAGVPLPPAAEALSPR